MEYETAVRLWNAGFPQYEDSVMAAEDISPQTAYNRRDHRTFDLSVSSYPETSPDYYTQGKFWPSCIFTRQYLESEEGRKNTLYFPTLSEIGDQLPGGFYSGRYKEVGTGVSNIQLYFAVYDPTPFEGKPQPEIRVRGKTEEEARSNLWLTLKEKGII